MAQTKKTVSKKTATTPTGARSKKPVAKAQVAAKKSSPKAAAASGSKSVKGKLVAGKASAKPVAKKVAKTAVSKNSKAAATTYRDLGIAFSDHFVEFGAQERLAAVISPQIDSITLGHSIPEAGVGEYFVYNLGDKIDFNHPNREGHRLLAEELAEAKFCEP